MSTTSEFACPTLGTDSSTPSNGCARLLAFDYFTDSHSWQSRLSFCPRQLQWTNWAGDTPPDVDGRIQITIDKLGIVGGTAP